MTNDLKLLGLKVRDKVSGFTGVVSCVSYDLFGCIQAIISPAADEKGELKDGRWFDVSRLVVLDHVPVMEIPGERFTVARPPVGEPIVTSMVAGPAEKPPR